MRRSLLRASNRLDGASARSVYLYQAHSLLVQFCVHLPPAFYVPTLSPPVSQKRTFALASDMTRQYKRKVEDMLREKSEEEQLRLAVEDKLAALQLARDQLERDLLQRLQLKEAEIVEQKNKMDLMAHEFGQMLKQTLDKMSEKIEITNDFALDGDGAAPIVRTFEDFSLGR